MKKIGKRLCALLTACWLLPAAAGAEIVRPQEPDGHIVRTLTVDGVQVAVDADVYGAKIEEVRAYSVEMLNLGSKPEERIDLSVWFGDAQVRDRATMWTEEDVRFSLMDSPDGVPWNGTHLDVSPFHFCYERITASRLEAESRWYPSEKKWARSAQENVAIEALDGFTLDEAIAQLGPMTDALGVTAVAQPIRGHSLSLEELKAAAQAHLNDGVAPDESVIEDWTTQDEYYDLCLPVLYHGLMVMPTPEHMPRITQFETPDTAVAAKISRRGVEQMSMDFIPGEEKALGEPFAPISAEEALEACGMLKSAVDWYEKGENARIGEIRLGYVMLSRNRAVTRAEARPAWYMVLRWDEKDVEWFTENGTEIRDETWYRTIAIDAQTGDMLLSW